jgi:hypothetical protein
MRVYSTDEWDWIGHNTEHEEWDFSKRVYIDRNGNRITGMLAGYFYFNKDDPRNAVEVKDGIRV